MNFAVFALLTASVEAATTTTGSLPFALPFDESSYNEEKLIVPNGEDGSAAVAMWKVDANASKLTVAMATTQTFVALGLNPSTPTMGGADIVACHLVGKDCGCSGHSTCRVVARDYFAYGYGTPAEDIVNDWKMLSYGTTSGGITWCVIERPFLTCNAVEDFQIFDLDASISGLLAFGTTGSGRSDLHYHGMNRKFTQFVFNEKALAEERKLPKETNVQFSEHVITSPIAVVPHDSTGAEVCSYHVLPSPMVGDDSRKHVVSVLFDQPIKEAQNAGLTHHTILYGCQNLVPGFTDGATVDCSSTWEFCSSDWLEPSKIIRQNEGVPAGKGVVVATILLRHFYNPKLLVGKKDQNRWKIFYTSQLRPLEPVVINLQTTYLNVPAQTKSVTRVYMPEECIERVGTVMIEAVRHHMHDYGVAGRLRHIRGNQELAPVHDLESYRRGVSEGWIAVNRRVEPGDMLIYECVYDNTLTKSVVWGERREDEMCVIALKTKNTNITSALSFLPSSGTLNTDANSYLFQCNAPAYKNLYLPRFRIDAAVFDARIANILPYKEPTCKGAGGPSGSQRSRALPKECPNGWRQPNTAEECKGANPSQSSELENCDNWEAGAPKCFTRTDGSNRFCWKANGVEKTKWGQTLVWCIPEKETEKQKATAIEEAQRKCSSDFPLWAIVLLCTAIPLFCICGFYLFWKRKKKQEKTVKILQPEAEMVKFKNLRDDDGNVETI